MTIGVIGAAQAVLVKLGTIPAAITDTATFLAEIPKMLGAVSNFTSFIHTGAAALQSKSMSVEDKVTALLNDAETFINQEFPNASASFDEVAEDVSTLIREVLGLFEATQSLASVAK